MSDDTADDIAPAPTLSDGPPLDAAQRLGLARFRLGAGAPAWITETLAFARDEVNRLTRELDAARAALRDALHCDECREWGMQRHAATGSLCCDEHAIGDGWTDDTHAAALRAARVP